MARKSPNRCTGVKCNVDSCHYWGAGNVCEANEIMVKNNLDSGDMEIGTIGELEAHASEETMCSTYKPK